MNSFFFIYPDQVEALNQFFMVKHQWFDSGYVTVNCPWSTVERSTPVLHQWFDSGYATVNCRAVNCQLL